MGNYLLPKVPSPYKLVEYIETTHTTLTNQAPVIKTNIIPNQDTICYIDYQQNQSYNKPSGGVWIFGARTSASAGEYGLVIGSDSMYASPYNTSSGNNTFKINNSTVSNNANRHQFLFKVREDGGTSRRFDNQMVSSTTGQSYVTYSEFEADHGLWIFGCLDGETDRNRVAMKLYSFKVYQGLDEELVANFIPVKNTLTNEYGMYDLVTKQFYGNSGNGNFTGGDEIKQREYLQSSGTQYIDTEYKPVPATTKFEFCFTPTSITVTSFPFGARKDTTAASATACTTYIPDSRLRKDWSGSNTFYTTLLNKTDKFIYSAYNNVASLNNETDAGTITRGTERLQYNFALFTVNTGGVFDSRMASLKVYYTKLWDNGTLVRDLIPITVGITGAMYDLVSNKIYYNLGTGSFTYGSEVLPTENKSFLSAKAIQGSQLAIDGYERVEYLQSSGTQYIDTGIVMKATHKIKTEFEALATTTGTARNYIFGADTNAMGVQFSYSTSTFFGVAGRYEQNGELVMDSNKHIGEVYNDAVYLDGVQRVLDKGTGSGAYTSDKTIWLFKSNSTPQTTSNRIYYYTMWDNDNLVIDLIPVKQKSNNEYGLYDLVEKKFYGNSGTGTFAGGNKIEEVEYIQSSGTQYIDTGVKQDKLNLHIKLRPLNDSTETFGLLVGARETNNSQVFLIDARNGNNFNCVEYGLTTNSIVGNYYNQDVEIKNEANVFTINDTQYTLNTYNFTKQYNVYLFSCNQDNSAIIRNQNKARIYFVKMVYDGVLVRNLIPVKINDEYCMYDNVEHKVYRNSGTGSFTGGSVIPDKSEGLYLCAKAITHVPSEYEEVEYIQNTAAGAYINTGINVSNASDSFLFKLSVEQIVTTATYSWWGGQREANRWIGTNPGDGLYPSGGVNYYQNGIKVTPSTANKMLRTEVESTLTGNADYTYNWLLFAREGTNTNFSTGSKLFSFEAYKNNELIARFIPVKKKSNSEYGMYDTVSKTFFGNDGTSLFTGGNPIPVEIKYYILMKNC